MKTKQDLAINRKIQWTNEEGRFHLLLGIMEQSPPGPYHRFCIKSISHGNVNV